MTGRKVLFNRVLLALIVGTLVKVLSAEPIHDDPTMLDFWMGEWDLSWKAGEETKKGTNSISRILDGVAAIP